MTLFSQPQRSDTYRQREAAYWARTMTTLLKAHSHSVRFVTDAAAYNPVSEALAKLLQWQMGSPADTQGWHAACQFAFGVYNDLLGGAPPSAMPNTSDAKREKLTGLLFGYFADTCPNLDAAEQALSAAFYALTLSDEGADYIIAVLESEASA